MPTLEPAPRIVSLMAMKLSHSGPAAVQRLKRQGVRRMAAPHAELWSDRAGAHSAPARRPAARGSAAPLGPRGTGAASQPRRTPLSHLPLFRLLHCCDILSGARCLVTNEGRPTSTVRSLCVSAIDLFIFDQWEGVILLRPTGLRRPKRAANNAGILFLAAVLPTLFRRSARAAAHLVPHTGEDRCRPESASHRQRGLSRALTFSPSAQ